MPINNITAEGWLSPFPFHDGANPVTSSTARSCSYSDIT